MPSYATSRAHDQATEVASRLSVLPPDCRAATRCLVAAMVAVSALSLCGCGRAKPGEVAVYPVQGQVAMEGRPLPGAFLVFHPASGEGMRTYPPRARADKDGKFSLTTYSGADGAPVGDYVVTVQWQKIVGQGDDARPTANLLPLRYANPKTSDLRVRVAQGANEPALIQLRR